MREISLSAVVMEVESDPSMSELDEVADETLRLPGRGYDEKVKFSPGLQPAENVPKGSSLTSKIALSNSRQYQLQ